MAFYAFALLADLTNQLGRGGGGGGRQLAQILCRYVPRQSHKVNP